jgi:hypothetical protein
MTDFEAQLKERDARIQKLLKDQQEFYLSDDNVLVTRNNLRSWSSFWSRI